jgi:hypothetical protein
MMSLSDPWAGIGPAATAAVFSGRRAAAEHPFDFFWGRDVEGRRLLALFYAPHQGSTQPRPVLNGIDIIEPDPAPGQRAAFIFALRQHDASDLFAQLCRDIMTATAECSNEAVTLSVAIRRAWAWHSLLRSGGSARLSEAEQQGLYGELLMLRRLISRRGATAALAAWRGPLDEPKDFRMGELAVEVKTRGGGRRSVEITSADQLDPAGIPRPILAVYHLAPAGAGTPGALSLDAIVSELRADLAATPAAEQFDTLLAAAGWSDDGHYDAPHWLSLDTELFLVTSDFPRIVASAVPVGVDQVRYRLTLDACAPFALSAAAFDHWLEEC